MASIQGGKKIIFDKDDWLGGLHPQYTADLSIAPAQIQLGSASIAGAVAFNPFRFLGYAAPGYAPQNVTGEANVTFLVRKGVVRSPAAYLITNGDEVHKLTLGAAPAIDTGAPFPHTITPHGGAADPTGIDAAIYTTNLGGVTRRGVFYSWQDDTSWDVGFLNFTGPTFDDDFMQTVPATPLAAPYSTSGISTEHHPLIVGEDDILYMGDRNFVHEFDGRVGANGTFSPEVLVFPEGYVVTSFAKVSNCLVVFAYLDDAGDDFYRSEAKAFFWDYLSSDPTYVYDLYDNFVSESFEFQGTVGCFTQGRTNDLEEAGARRSSMRLFNGSIFETLASFEDDVPIRGGVQVNEKLIQWNSEGNIYSWGQFFDGLDNTLNKIAKTSPGSGQSGMLLAAQADRVFVSSDDTTSGALQYFIDDTYTGESRFSTSLIDGNFPDGQMGQVKSVKIVFGKTSSNGQKLIVNMFDEGGNQTTIIASGDNFEDVTTRTYVQDFMDDYPFFHGLRFTIEWDTSTAITDAPIIERIEVDFETINIEDI